VQPRGAGYFLQWKGRESGPFTLEEIRVKLRDNEIGLLHYVRAGSGVVVTVEEFLATDDARREAEQRSERERVARQEEERVRAAYQERLAAEESRNQELQGRLAQIEGRAQQRHDMPGNYAPKRTSGFAITALVMGVLNFVPFLNAITWILALVFGHIALSQINRDPDLEGRGMAIAGLAITYTLLGIGIVFGILYASHTHFSHF